MKFLSKKVFYLPVLALLAVMASGHYLLSDSTTVSAQKGEMANRGDIKGKVARAEQLAFALRLGSADEYTVFGAKGVRSGGATVTGKSGTGSDEASLGDSGSGLKARSDLNKSLAMIKQLPCQDMEAALTGGTFGPGVYCAPSAALAGQMVLDAGGDSTGTFVFRIEGAMKSAENFRMELTGEAKPGNIYFVADTASLGAWNSIIGTVIARGSVDVGAGTSIKGRAISKESEVILAGGASLAMADAYIQICKNAAGATGVYEILALTEANQLIRFNSNAPGTLLGAPVAITGTGTFSIRAIDRRPATGEIFGIGGNNILYRIDPVTGAATAVSAVPIPSTSGFVGFDFNPLVDRIRLINEDQQNFRVNPNDATFITDTPLSQDATGAAYTNNFPGAVSTTLYDISEATDNLLIQNPPNAGTLTPVGPLGFDVVRVNGFDIFGLNNVAFAGIRSGMTTSNLYTINLATGAATSLGNIDTAVLTLGLTVLRETTAAPSGLEGRIFQFQINGGRTIEVPVGSCSAPILVTDGNNSIQELLGGFFLNRPDRDPATGGTWFNRFRLVGVAASGYLPSSGAPAGTGITSVDLPTRTVNFNVAESPSTNPLILTFTNQFAIPVVIEICKFPSTVTTTGDSTVTPPTTATSVAVADTSVLGFFDFTVDALPGSRFSVPVGFCTGPIQILAAAEPGPVRQSTFVRVTELAEAGFTLESALTMPADRLVQFFLDQGIVSSNECSRIGEGPTPPACVESNNGGGYATGRVIEADTPSDQTIFQFFNRTNPGIIKVCKIAGRGVPVGTEFDFIVRGRQAQAQAAGSGTRILPGRDIERSVRVPAGPAEQGGFCRIVTETSGANTLFIVGTLAYVEETAVVPDVAGVQNGGFGDDEAFAVDSNDAAINTSPATEIRVSLIRVNGADGTNVTGSQTVQLQTLGADATDPNPDLFSPADSDLERRVIFRVGRGETVVTFVNRLFSPTQLKICKAAGVGFAPGTDITFNITIGTEGGLVPGQTNEPITVGSVTIPAGPVGTNGNCAVINGPYEAPFVGDASGITPVPPSSYGTFDVGSIITVTESGAASTMTVSTPTGPASALTVDAANRRATLLLGFPGGFNELIFVNSAPGGTPVTTGYSLAGRVMTPDGGGLRNAQVILTKTDGTRMTVPTTSLGYYSFNGLANESYTVTVASRRYRFSARNVDLSASLANVDFTGIE